MDLTFQVVLKIYKDYSRVGVVLTCTEMQMIAIKATINAACILITDACLNSGILIFIC